MIIETAGIENAQEILDLQKLAYQEEAELYGDYSIPPLTQTLEQIQDECSHQVFLRAIEDGKIIGSVRAFLHEGTCYIGRLIVHPDYQNQGIGTRLMQEIERAFPQARRYELFTGERSARNLHLYHKLGYTEFRKQALNEKVTLVFMEKLKEPEQITPPSYQLPKAKIISLTFDALLGRRRSLREDVRQIVAGMQPPACVLGQEFIPQQGPCLLACNHYYRPGLGIWWPAMVITAALPCETHWVMTGAWTYPDPLRERFLRPVIAWAFGKVSQVYGLTAMPPMPPNPREQQERTQAVRRLVSYVRATPQAVVAMAPEGGDTLTGLLGWPPSGVGRLIAHLHQLGLALIPVGIHEQEGQIQVRFGPPAPLELPVGLPSAEFDRAISRQVMGAIARQLPEAMRGEFA